MAASSFSSSLTELYFSASENTIFYVSNVLFFFVFFIDPLKEMSQNSI